MNSYFVIHKIMILTHVYGCTFQIKSYHTWAHHIFSFLNNVFFACKFQDVTNFTHTYRLHIISYVVNHGMSVVVIIGAMAHIVFTIIICIKTLDFIEWLMNVVDTIFLHPYFLGYEFKLCPIPHSFRIVELL